MEIIELDGSYGEGGGQILRTALSLSSITKKPFILRNIRLNRSPKGLNHQHLTVCRSVRKICRGELYGDELGSTSISFYPSKIVAGRYNFRIPTAGSSPLLAQTVIPILLFGEKRSEIRISGGTAVKNAPTYDYFSEIFLRALNLMGIKISSSLIKSGYFPEGGGEFILSILPTKEFVFPSIFPREEPKAIIRVSNLPFHIALREKKIFVQHGIEKVKIIEEKNGVGNSILFSKGFVGSCLVGEKGIRAENLALSSIKEVEEQEAFDVDKFLGDQIMLYASLFSNKYGEEVSYSCKTTKHMLSNAYVIESFLDVDIKISDRKIRIYKR